MKFAIIRDNNEIRPQYRAATANRIDDANWSDRVLAAEKKYEWGFDAAKKVDIFTVFEVIGNDNLGRPIWALLSKAKNILIFSTSFGVKEFYWKTVYIRHLFEGM